MAITTPAGASRRDFIRLIGRHTTGLCATRGLAFTAAGRKAGSQASSHAQGAGQPDEVAAAGARRSCDRH